MRVLAMPLMVARCTDAGGMCQSFPAQDKRSTAGILIFFIKVKNPDSTSQLASLLDARKAVARHQLTLITTYAA